MKRRYSLTLSFIAFSLLAAQTYMLSLNPARGFLVIVERSDFAKYENGRYVGHVYREARLDVLVEPSSLGTRYSGDVMILEEAFRDMMPVAKRMDTVFKVDYTQRPDGTTLVAVDTGYPLLRGIPFIPQQPIKPGNKWEGTGTVVIRGNPQEKYVRVPVLLAYELVGLTKYNGQDAYYIKAQYAIRYKGTDKYGEPTMVRTEGGRTADIYISVADGTPLFIRELVDETYYYQNGNTVRYKGFLLHFIRGSMPSQPVLIALGDTGSESEGDKDSKDKSGAGSSGLSDTGNPNDSNTATLPSNKDEEGSNPVLIKKTDSYEVVDSPKGQVLLLFDLRFMPDSDELLASEKPRLDEIAKILLSIPDRMFLVEGHTADVGNPKGQYSLSEARAKKIVDELVKRGVPSGRFIYKGWGADRPIAPNDTEQNRARNRRVEITILH